MVMLREVRAAEGVTFALSGNPQDLQRIADQLATVGNAHLATLVRQATITPMLAAGGSTASLSVRLGQAGVPHALMEAASGARVELDRSIHEVGPVGSPAPIRPEV